MLYDRMKAVAGMYWKVPPWELKQRIEDGQCSFKDVLELINLLGHDPLVAPWLFRYLSPDTVERISTKKKADKNRANFGQLLRFIQPKNPREAAFLESLKKEVHDGA